MTATATAVAEPATRTCPHTPPCPPADARDHDAACVVVAYPEQGWELRCNGVICFFDTGELLPDGSRIDPHRPDVPHSGRRLPDPTGGLYPTKTRLALLTSVATGNVARRTWGTGEDNWEDVDLRSEKRANAAVEEMRCAGWIRLLPQTWQTADVVTTAGSELRYWDATVDGKVLLRRAGIKVPTHWVARVRAEHAARVARMGEERAAKPAIPDFTGLATHYGVQVNLIGEDGDQAVAIGHPGKRRALAAINRHVRRDLGWRSLLAEWQAFSDVDEVLEATQECWAVLKTQCNAAPGCAGPDWPSEEAEAAGAEPCHDCRAIREAGWWLQWGNVTEDTPGAFPVTVLE